MTSRRRGFTLIELLVVIAIIGILAAMLFPVFARARESARKTQCLANVKNLAIAINMYLTDYDRLWPSEKRSEVNDNAHPNSDNDNGCTRMAGTKMNPYLQPAVILDDYTKNRDIWRCPSARTYGNHGISNPEGKDWWARANEVDPNEWGSYGVGQCSDPFPPGWGGSITDSIIQGGQHGSGPGAFENSLAVISLRDVATSSFGDAAKYVVCGEASQGHNIENPVALSYPDAYAMCGASPGSVTCCDGNWVDWDNCSWSRDCGADHDEDYGDTEFRKKNGFPRHLNGSNVGFADGHAKWFNSEDILNNYAPDSDWRLNGLLVCFGTSPGAADARRNRPGIWGGFENGVCQMWGAMGLKKSCE